MKHLNTLIIVAMKEKVEIQSFLLMLDDLL